MTDDKPTPIPEPPPAELPPPQPLIPTCDRCKQLVTRCTCDHNKLQK